LRISDFLLEREKVFLLRRKDGFVSNYVVNLLFKNLLWDIDESRE